MKFIKNDKNEWLKLIKIIKGLRNYENKKIYNIKQEMKTKNIHHRKKMIKSQTWVNLEE